MADISVLPNEILEHLFRFLDGVSLAKAAKVNRRWRQVGLHLMDDPLCWPQRCIEEIPQTIKEEMMIEIMNKKIVSDVKWKQIYSSWYRSRYIGRWERLRQSFRIQDVVGSLSQIAFHDDFVFTSHNNANCSSVKQWDAVSGEMQATIARHPPCRRYLHLNLLIPVRCRYRERVRLVDAAIIVVSTSDAVRVHSVNPKTTDVSEVWRHTFSAAPTTATSTHGANSFAAVAEDGSGAVYRFDFEQSNGLRASVISTFHCPYKFVESVSLWRDFLVTGSGDGHVAVWRLVHQEDPDVKPAQQAPQQNGLRLYQRLGLDADGDEMELDLVQTYGTRTLITDVFIRGASLIFVNEAGILTHLRDVHQSSPIKKNLFGIIQARPSALTVYGSLLALGDETGKVTVFRFEGDLDLDSVRWEVPDAVFTVESGRRIDQIVVCDDGEGPTLLVSSGRGALEIVRYFHPSI